MRVEWKDFLFARRRVRRSYAASEGLKSLKEVQKERIAHREKMRSDADSHHQRASRKNMMGVGTPKCMLKKNKRVT